MIRFFFRRLSPEPTPDLRDFDANVAARWY